MATIYLTIKDEEDQTIAIEIDANESVPQNPQEWSPAQVLSSHLYEYLVCLQGGVSSEVSRRHKHH